jgi:hypothetical protein
VAVFRRNCLLRLGHALVFFALGLSPASADESSSRREIVTDLKEFQKSLGFPETGNFKDHDSGVQSYFRCYYTGKLELPASYDKLGLRQGEGNCTVDPAKYDIFFYRIEAVASGKTPVTSSLTKAPLARMLVVVPHEDFHHHKEVGKASADAGEAAATLAGFLAAAEFARGRFGEESEIYRKLAGEPEIFLRKSEIVNRYYGELSGLYAKVRSGQVSGPAALEEKRRAFMRLESECKAIQPDPVSFNKCPAALNNAGLAFDWTYTASYAVAYGVYLANGRDARTTIAALRRGLAAR